MRSVEKLPEGYGEIYSVDLQKNKKLSLLVNGIAVAIMILMVVPMRFLVPIRATFSPEKLGGYFGKLALTLALLVLYIVLHEAVHGIAMKICGTKKVKYGFTGLYAFAGSSDYYGKGAYIFIALAPVVLWGAVLAVVNVLIPPEWFWVVYFIQINNISGAAGDFFVTVKFSRMPKDILVQDYGVGMTVYSKDCGKENA
jgi:hypothetical protein